MTNAQRILALLDARLTSKVELTLYGRAALHLGFPNAPKEHALSRDVDAVLWLGQAEELGEKTNFWDAIEHVNQELADQELYISHFFTESQVILLPGWYSNRVSPSKANGSTSTYIVSGIWTCSSASLCATIPSTGLTRSSSRGLRV